MSVMIIANRSYVPTLQNGTACSSSRPYNNPRRKSLLPSLYPLGKIFTELAVYLPRGSSETRVAERVL